GQRQDVQLAPDRNTYVVHDMPTTRGGTALDVLRNVPSVDVDIDNIVSLRGNTGVVVQINGRPSPMKPQQLGNFLSQLPADVVDKVEVVTNPSARDDPEGTAGIINIVLREKPESQRSGGLNVGVGTRGHVDVGGNFGLEHGPLSFYGSYGFFRENRLRRDSVFREDLLANPTSFLAESGKRTQLPLAHTLTGNIDYSPGEHDVLSLEGVYSGRNQEETYNVLYRDLNSSRQMVGLSRRYTSGPSHEFSSESALSYKHTFAEKAHKLSAELRATADGEGGPTSILAQDLGLDGTPVDTTAREHQTPWERPREYSFKTDYVRPFSNGMQLETGYKGSLLRIHTTLDTDVFDTAQTVYVVDPTRTSDFVYRQVVNAGYGQLGGESGKFQYQAGLRVERAAARFAIASTGASYDNPYNSFFPSGLIAYHLDDAHQAKLSYSTRIRRPDDVDLLDPTPHVLDPLNISRGNPRLQPEYIRSLELGFQRSDDHTTVQVTPYYRHTVNAIRSLRTLDTAGVSTRTFANVASTNAYGTDFTVSLSGGKVSGFASATAFRQVSDAANLSPSLSASTYGWNARTNAMIRLSPTVDFQALVTYVAPMTVEQGRNAARARVSLALRQKLMNDQLNLTLRIIDPFNTSLERSTTIDPAFRQLSDRRRVMRGIQLNATWLFGHVKNESDRIDFNESGG
ncbi:MAG TPA: TonB-dependent receptor, partial [Gemmatimonadaceae bacterium]|nr:TonB-dependent receptor [Gemmatimonadaceae bacterium]